MTELNHTAEERNHQLKSENTRILYTQNAQSGLAARRRSYALRETVASRGKKAEMPSSLRDREEEEAARSSVIDAERFIVEVVRVCVCSVWVDRGGTLDR